MNTPDPTPAAPTPEAVPQYVKDAAVELTQTFSVVSWKGEFHPELVSVVKADNPQLLSLLSRHAPSPAVGQPSDTERLIRLLRENIEWDEKHSCYRWAIYGPKDDLHIGIEEVIAAAMRADKQGRGEV